LEIWYLIDAVSEGSVVKLRFLDPVSNQLKEFRYSAYKPYFFLPYPLSPVDQENVHSLHGEVESVKKIDLYTNEHREVAKVKVYNPYFLKKP
jgi:hypothetical protein